MKEPFVPKSTISEMLPLSLRREFFRRINPVVRLYPPNGGTWPAHVPAARITTATTAGWSDKDWQRIIDDK